MKSGRGGCRLVEKVVAAVAAKGKRDTRRPRRLAYSSGKHKEGGNNSRGSSTRKNIYGSSIPPTGCKFFGKECFTFCTPSPSLSLSFSSSNKIPRSLTPRNALFLFLMYRRMADTSLCKLHADLKLSVLRTTKLDDIVTASGKYGIERKQSRNAPWNIWLRALRTHSGEIRRLKYIGWKVCRGRIKNPSKGNQV